MSRNPFEQVRPTFLIPHFPVQPCNLLFPIHASYPSIYLAKQTQDTHFRTRFVWGGGRHLHVHTPTPCVSPCFPRASLQIQSPVCDCGGYSTHTDTTVHFLHHLAFLEGTVPIPTPLGIFWRVQYPYRHHPVPSFPYEYIIDFLEGTVRIPTPLCIF